MMGPAGPMADLIGGQTGLACAALEALCEAMGRVGHTGALPQRCLRRGLGPRKIPLPHLLLVAIPGPSHHPSLLVAWLPPRRARDDTPFDPVDPILSGTNFASG